MSRVQPARQVAFDVIRAVSSADAYANLLLPTALSRAALSGSDAALATELTYGTLRQRGTYDAVIELASGRPLDQISGFVLDALRLGTHQLLSMRTATHAAVNESVQLVRAEKGQRTAGFANAVLRRIAAQDAAAWERDLVEAARSDDERLSVRSSHPVWILRAFRRSLKAEGRENELDALLAADNESPQVSMVALPTLAEKPEEFAAARYSPVGFALEHGAPEPVVRGSDGRLRVQDEGSQLVALTLAAAGETQQGERWLDLCAGPGGKTALLAAQARAQGATVVANEITPARAGLVRQALSAIPEDVDVFEQDGREFARAHPGQFDRVLVDAPCSGLGALRRRPESRWRKKPEDVPELVSLQTELLDAAVVSLKEGGIVAYVTCSPHLAETVGVVEDVLRRSEGTLTALPVAPVMQGIAVSELDLPAEDSSVPHVQLWPHRHGTDAMFIALLQKKPAV